MLIDILCFYINDLIMKGFGMVINNGFVCVENDEQVFEGIFMRRVVLKELNKYICLLNKQVLWFIFIILLEQERKCIYNLNQNRV